MKRHFSLLYYYIGKEFILSFFIAFLFFFFIFFINHMLLLAEQILSKNVPIFDVVLLILYSLPAIGSFSFPFASLVGALMAVGRLSSDNEILAIQASGIPLLHIFTPMLIIGVIVTLLSFLVGDYFLPLGTINFQKLYKEMIYSNPELELESYSIKKYENSVMITGNVEGREISNLIIFDKTTEKDNRIISAVNANLIESTEQEGVVSLQLNNVFSQTVSKNRKGNFEYFTSDKMIYNILLKDLTFSVTNLTAQQMSSVDVYREIIDKRVIFSARIEQHERKTKNVHFDLMSRYSAVVENSIRTRETVNTNTIQQIYTQLLNQQNVKLRDRSLQQYEIEFYKKFSLPFGCFAFVILAFPLGLFSRRSGRSVGFGVGLFVSVLYWGMLFVGHTMLGLKMNFSPFLSMWFPNFIILITGIILLILRRNR